MSENKIQNNKGNPYDDVFRTMVNDCKRLLLPVLNEMFHYSYDGDEKIELLPTERYLHNINGKSQRRGTDSAFRVIDKNGYERNFIIECQSTPDNSMSVRILEYGIKFAIDNANTNENKISITVPNTGVFQLRSNSKTQNTIQVEVIAPDNKKLAYNVPIIKMQDYLVDDIFDKKLSFMIPFYMFNNEDKLKNMEKQNLSDDIIRECNKIKKKLDDSNLSTFEKKSITKMFLQIMNELSSNDSAKTLCKEVEEIMGGRILDYEAKDILNEGIRQGIEEGKELGKEEGIKEGIKEGEEKGKVEIFNNIITPELKKLEANYNKATTSITREKMLDRFFNSLKICKKFFPDWDNKKLIRQVNNLKNSLGLKLNDIELQR